MQTCVSRKCTQKRVEAMCRLGHLIITFRNAWRRRGDAILFITVSAVFDELGGIRVVCTCPCLSLYSHYSGVQSTRLASTREDRNAYRILTKETEGRWSHGIPKRRWEYNIKIWHKAVDCVHLTDGT